MLEASIRTLVTVAFKEDSKSPDEEKSREMHIELATCMLLEDFYRSRKKELSAILGYDEAASGAYADAVRKMFL